MLSPTSTAAAPRTPTGPLQPQFAEYDTADQHDAAPLRQPEFGDAAAMDRKASPDFVPVSPPRNDCTASPGGEKQPLLPAVPFARLDDAPAFLAPAADADAYAYDDGEEDAVGPGGSRIGASSRRRHYDAEVRGFYEQLPPHRLVPAAAAGVAAGRRDADPAWAAAAASVRSLMLRRVPAVLDAFHGAEEDLFRLLRHKYFAPAHPFRHHAPRARGAL
jgi:hypothetical protein